MRIVRRYITLFGFSFALLSLRAILVNYNSLNEGIVQTARYLQHYYSSGDTLEEAEVKNLDKNTYYMLIAVISSPAHFEDRMNIRNSWIKHETLVEETLEKGSEPTFWNTSLGNHEKLSFRVLFMVGHSSDGFIHDHVRCEIQKFKDIVLGDFIDSYHNLTYKTLLTLNTFTKYYFGTKYLMKIDDNVELHLDELLNILTTAPPTDFVLGHVLNASIPIREKCNEKWYIAPEAYDQERFPMYTTGPAYIMTYNAAKQILAACPSSNFPLHLEDVIFTGLCRERAHIAIKDDERICQKPPLNDSHIVCATKHQRHTWIEERDIIIKQLFKQTIQLEQTLHLKPDQPSTR